jgi:protein-S-isoprenylcysteine O-methyltransferase Ste14
MLGASYLKWNFLPLSSEMQEWSQRILLACSSAFASLALATSTTREEHELVTGRPYRWVRHPLYTVGSSFFASLSVVAANWFMGLASVVVLLMLLVRLPKEEEKLIERFGDEYRAYMERTGRLLPCIKRSSE